MPCAAKSSPLSIAIEKRRVRALEHQYGASEAFATEHAAQWDRRSTSNA
jgi:hypothetical protein